MSAQRKVLLLGSGFVTKPCLDILVKDGVRVTVACRTLEAAKKLSLGFDDVTPISLDVEDPVALDAEVAKVDLVVRLVAFFCWRRKPLTIVSQLSALCAPPQGYQIRYQEQETCCHNKLCGARNDGA